MSDEELRAALTDLSENQRGYADYFHRRNQREEELDILEALMEALDGMGSPLSNPRPVEANEDPPDAWAEFDGSRVALEFTEFVDEAKVAEERRNGPTDWKLWGQDEVQAKLLERVHRKDGSAYGAGIASWLVIHCDEPALTLEVFSRYLAAQSPIPVRTIDRCLVLLSYEPKVRTYPLLEVRVAKGG